MKMHNDIFGLKDDISRIVNSVYDTGYDKGYHDRQIEEEFDEDREKAIKEAYQNGLYDAWECAQRIWNMVSFARDKIFDTENLGDIFDSYSPSKAIAKIKEYEEKFKADAEKIKVGDEVFVGISQINPGIVTRLPTADFKKCSVVWEDGSVGDWTVSDLRKTGKHYDIQSIFDQMKNEQ